MDSINDIISSLSNDDIEMLKGVASSILGSSNNDNTTNDATSNTANNDQIQNALGMLNSQNNNLGLSVDDFNLIIKAKKIFEKMNSKSSKNADLIMALKPHLSPKYRDRADQAIKMLQLFETLPYLKELF